MPDLAAPERGTHRTPVPLAAAVLAALVGAGICLRWTCTWAAHAAVARLLGWAPAEAVRGATRTAFGIAALTLCGVIVSRAARSLSRASLAAVVALALGVGVASYARSLRDELTSAGQWQRFDPRVVALKPNGSIDDPYPNRPHFPYRTNRWGFREPDFALDKAKDSLRVVLIGDSYVFGIGVPVEETLSRKLSARLAERYPGVPVEVVNLGMPGNNFVSYVDVYRAAVERLAPDAVVLCLTLPNDLSSWDWGTEHREAHRPSLYSAARWLLASSTASALWAAARLEREATPEAVARFRSDVERLVAARPPGTAPPLLVMPYQAAGSWLHEALSERDRITLLPAPGDDPAWFIPGDGHPTGAGNGHFAERIADALGHDPVMAPRLR